MRDFLLLREDECADTFCNFAEEMVVAGVGEVGYWLLVCAETAPQARNTMHPALKQVAEMELLSLKVMVRSNSLLGYPLFLIEQAG